ncbi:lysine transporter LysE [Maritimibacter sp. 55A14]|uniref:LysE family translocator n=1 Tax=Maritimibacter sp. 55A14 TaxID=2174844 RepID=UPI000D607059|nr:LysE family translocator [Maritimibacter sp. 55A14]PWE32384.1 lysine transporter LysE [Maritimibacter sp. 55A14]
MTISIGEMALYSGALLILFLTPGPVWVAVIARGISGGFHGVWPLALGVSLGDMIWPFLAIFGVSWIVSVYADFLTVLRYAACLLFLAMGGLLIRHAGHNVSGGDSRLTRPGVWAGFSAGVMAILGNPKAILFYMGMLPGFFDMSRITAADIAAICAASMVVPLLGNLALGLSLSRARALMRSPGALKRLNQGAGLLLIAVGLIIALSPV